MYFIVLSTIINEMNSISNVEPEFVDYNNIEDTYSIKLVYFK